MSWNFSRDFRDIKYCFLQFLLFSRHLIPATFSTRDFFTFDWEMLATLIFSKILKLFFLTTVNTRDFNIYPGLYKNLFTLGGHMAPRQKIPRTCQVGLKRGRVSKGGLNITFNPKKSNPRSSGCLRHNLKMSRQTALRRDFARIL